MWLRIEWKESGGSSVWIVGGADAVEENSNISTPYNSLVERITNLNRRITWLETLVGKAPTWLPRGASLKFIIILFLVENWKGETRNDRLFQSLKHISLAHFYILLNFHWINLDFSSSANSYFPITNTSFN